MTSKSDVIKATLCNYETLHPRAACLNRNCNACGPHLLEEHYRDVLTDNRDKSISWNKWEYVTVEKTSSSKRVISCVTNTTSIDVFMNEYKKDMETFPSHMFRADWQHCQMRACIANLPEDEACLCMDYAENYQCRFQGEVQSAFFDQNQVTLHPMMAYYTQVVDNETLDVKHAIIGVTNDSCKDASGVKAFKDGALSIIEKEKRAPLKRIHEFTDGCAAQYKGKTAFYDLSTSTKPPVTIRNFFETSHGKSVCDGLGAVVKMSCYHAVISGKEIICNAEDLLHYCEKKLQVPPPGKVVTAADGSKHLMKREFVFIERNAVIRDRPDVKTLSGTRKLHSMKSTCEDMKLQVRNISCYCKSCINQTSDPCNNEDYVEQWVPVDIQLSKKQSSEQSIPREDHVSLPNTSKGGGTNTGARARRCDDHCDEVAIEAVDLQNSSLSQLSSGDFVAVKLYGPKKKSCKIYMAEVTGFEEEEVELSFMKKTGNDMYTWPSEKDTSWEPVENIICIVGSPQVANAREQFRFSQKDFERIRDGAMEKTFEFK